MAPATIQTVTTQDREYAQVWALREAVLRKPLGLSLRDEDLSSEASETIIAAANEAAEIIGCVMLRRISDEEVKLRQMAVATAYQGQGIGLALVRKAEEIARRDGYKTITLHARDLAVPFYLKAGYSAEGEPFSEVGIPHLTMNKTLG
jgi:predicted GNAT family N-acyltransferase